MTDAWYDDLREKTLRLLAGNEIFVPIVEDAFDDKFRDTWAHNMTHPAMDPSSGFESQEFIGDKFWSSAIALYLKNAKEDISASEMTNGNSRMSNNRKMASLYDYHGLSGSVILPDGLDGSDHVIAADSMEAYIGSLYSVLLKVKGGIGAAFFVVYSIIETMFNQYPIEELIRGSVADMINGYRLGGKKGSDRSVIATYTDDEKEGWKVYIKTTHYEMNGRQTVVDVQGRPVIDSTRPVEKNLVIQGKGWMDDSYDKIEAELKNNKLRKNSAQVTNYKYNGQGDMGYTAIRVLRSGTHNKKIRKDGHEAVHYIYTVFGVNKDKTLDHILSDWIPASGTPALVKRALRLLSQQ